MTGQIQITVRDNDKDEILIVNRDNGQAIRSWSYNTETERRAKMGLAREFAEGWFQAMRTKTDSGLMALADERIKQLKERHK